MPKRKQKQQGGKPKKTKLTLPSTLEEWAIAAFAKEGYHYDADNDELKCRYKRGSLNDKCKNAYLLYFEQEYNNWAKHGEEKLDVNNVAKNWHNLPASDRQVFQDQAQQLFLTLKASERVALFLKEAKPSKQLSSDMMLSIAMFCDAETVSKLSVVCKQWYNVIQQFEQQIWRSICQQQFPELHEFQHFEAQNWKEFYCAKMKENPFCKTELEYALRGFMQETMLLLPLVYPDKAEHVAQKLLESAKAVKRALKSVEV